MSMHSDDRLARRAADGDRRAFAAIFKRYHQDLYRFCLAIVGNPQDAQDALQGTMVKALRALPGEQRRIELKPWLYRVAHNESIELLRRRRETGQLDGELAAPGAGLAEEATVRERLRHLLADLGELPERQRQTLIMRELAGLEFAEIGAALGTSAAVARQTVYEARLSLRQMDEGRQMNCEKVTMALSDGDGRVTGRRDIRAHLRSCASCRGFGEQISGRERDLAALSPLPAVAAAGLLQGLLGGHGGGAAAAALGGTAANSAGASVVFKGAATVAVVAAIGAGAADRGGLIDLWPGGKTSTQASLVRPAAEVKGSPGEGGPAAIVPSAAAALATGEAGRQSADLAGSPDVGEPGGHPVAGNDGAHQAGAPAAAAVEGRSAGSDQGGSGDRGASVPAPSGEGSAGEDEEQEKDKGEKGHGQGKAKGHEKEKQKGDRKEEKKEEKEKAKEEKGAGKENEKGGPGQGKGPPATPPGQAKKQETKEESAPPPVIAPEATGEEAPPGHGKGKKSPALP